MARRATIQLKVHGKVVQSVPLDREDIECLIDGLRQVTPCTPRTAWSTCSLRSGIGISGPPDLSARVNVARPHGLEWLGFGGAS